QAFKGLVFRDALFPREAYRRMWEQLECRLTQRQACQTIVALLEMAARDGVEGALAERLQALLAAGELPDLRKLREEFAPRKVELPHGGLTPTSAGRGGISKALAQVLVLPAGIECLCRSKGRTGAAGHEKASRATSSDARDAGHRMHGDSLPPESEPLSSGRLLRYCSVHHAPLSGARDQPKRNRSDQ